jgi:Asp/Glu/hydantoin racemase
MMMGKKLFLIHTVNWFMDLIVKPFVGPMMQRHPDLEIYNILDDSLLAESVKYGSATENVKRRIVNYAFMAENAGADAVMVTCTTVNEASAIARPMMKIPVFNIDEPMALEALKAGSNFGIIGSVPTSPYATQRLLNQKAAEMNKQISTKIVVKEEAYAALMAGKTEEHNGIIADTMDKLAKEVDVILLGQISLARIVHDPGKPVLQVGKSGYEEAERILFGK